MKQIIVITRIDREEEFAGLFPTPQSTISGKDEERNIRLDIHNGVHFFNKKNLQIAKEIEAFIDPDAVDVLIVVHYTGSFEGFRKALGSIQNGRNWQVRQYSSGDKNYDEVETALRGVPADPSNVESVREIFSSDYVLEAKLELLHTCLMPETIPSEEDLSMHLKDFAVPFREFEIRVRHLGKKIEKENRTAKLTWDNPGFIAALTELRKALLNS